MIHHRIGTVVRVLRLDPGQVQHMPAPGVAVFGIVKAGPVNGLYAVLLMTNEVVHIPAQHLTTTKD
ncbi:hypothetical protein [Tsukamurella pseudospumae]|uniref:Uncharacterized protein n=1 Tax=Tsukamurella pseudospumae TaxID=239498 RepID=A0A137ZRU0_9ACTN|nr:hypothetical protein [Tsukamurella pseudospumae]KXP00869.1 hypothetical protein AXK61_12735 [Tsukamurella pseudospumae]